MDDGLGESDADAVPALQGGSLERGYRRLLAVYPAAYRRVHEDEMLAVLMTAAPAGQRRPGLAEAADLILGALRVRCQPSGGSLGWRGALALISAVTVLGLLAGIASAAANPPRSASEVTFILESTVFSGAGATRTVVISGLPATAARAVSAGHGQNSPGGEERTRSRVQAVTSVAPKTSLAAEAFDRGRAGALCGAVIGSIGVVALSRSRRRFRMT